MLDAVWMNPRRLAPTRPKNTRLFGRQEAEPLHLLKPVMNRLKKAIQLQSSSMAWWSRECDLCATAIRTSTSWAGTTIPPINITPDQANHVCQTTTVSKLLTSISLECRMAHISCTQSGARQILKKRFLVTNNQGGSRQHIRNPNQPNTNFLA